MTGTRSPHLCAFTPAPSQLQSARTVSCDDSALPHDELTGHHRSSNSTSNECQEPYPLGSVMHERHRHSQAEWNACVSDQENEQNRSRALSTASNGIHPRNDHQEVTPAHPQTPAPMMSEADDVANCGSYDNSCDWEPFLNSSSLLNSDDSSLATKDLIIDDNEVQELQRNRTTVSNNCIPSATPHTVEAAFNASEDYWASLFCDPLELVDEDCVEESNDNQGHDNMTHEACEESRSQRSTAHQVGGLKGWKYANAFEELEIKLDNSDSFLGVRFLNEANQIVNNVVREIRTFSEKHQMVDECSITREDLLDVFLPTSLLEKLKSYVNRVLLARDQKPTTVQELKHVVVTHALAASYHTTVSVMSSEENKEFYYQTGLSGKRYSDIWSSLSGTAKRRQRLEAMGQGWSNKPVAGNQLITEIEQELSAVNRSLLYVPGQTVFSLDDDHQRLRSRAVAEFTTLSHVNNPQKALGPVNNALCSALTSTFLASHYSRVGEKLIDVWQRLVQLVQGTATPGSIMPMTDAVFAADRGYNSQETVNFVTDRLGATGIGTHKRSLDYPFVFGEGKVRNRHKGMVVQEKGCRAVYSATRLAKERNGREVQALVYRESYSGRIASVYHNNRKLFGAHLFTLVPKTEFINRSLSDEDCRRFHEVYRKSHQGMESESELHPAPAASELQVFLAMNQVRHFTLLQSEDPGWFLVRSFQFTSRTTNGFLSIFAADFEKSVLGLAEILKGKAVIVGSDFLPNSRSETKTLLEVKWKVVLDVLGKNVCNAEEDQRQTGDAVAKIMNATVGSLQALRKEQLLAILSNVNHRQTSSTLKQQLINKVMELKSSAIAGDIQLVAVQTAPVTEGEQASIAKDALLKRLYEKSLHAWFMKPLTSTPGMKEGTRNESKVLREIPDFFSRNKVVSSEAYQPHANCRQNYTFNSEVQYIRTAGLIGSKKEPLLACSPDGIVAISTTNDLKLGVIEVKTMTAIATIAKAKSVCEQYGEIVRLRNIGGSQYSTNLFHQLVPTSDYRMQCIHHAAVSGKNNVFFVVATGSHMGVGTIIYIAWLEFRPSVIANYIYCLMTVRVAAFDWIGDKADKIPKQYDALLLDSYATDLYSFGSFYNLAKAYKQLANDKGPLPPSRMIRPSALVFWNLLKGGVDEFSRNMKQMCYTNSSENPIVSVIGRLLCSQVANAGVVYRMVKARLSGMLPRNNKQDFETRASYRKLRHSLTKCMTFSSFVKNLAKEVTESLNESRAVHCSSHLASTMVSNNEALKQLYVRNVVEKYNREEDTRRRLCNAQLHSMVRGQPAYCSLCSYTHALNYKGKVFKKRGGSKVRQWCRICRQPICKSCWGIWHTRRCLTKGTISASDLDALIAKARKEMDKE
eukprot:TRINITY_DN479_c3_g1_i11.p1 TRINITY_DN479_c3_g1~~TRINITY_DN479_c3_g1_i11.p1  ORF type:complete len:1373 (+),score=138.00 TRINITY_DN479_c3_g1_i11:3191-7309(+)